MKKRILISIFLLLGLCGCENNVAEKNIVENYIVGEEFIHTDEENSIYGDITTRDTFVFKENGIGLGKIDIEFSESFHDIVDDDHSTYNFTYTIDEENKTISISSEKEDNYELTYNEEDGCLYHDTRAYCK